MNLFAYDFGYGWLWNYGHLIAVVPTGALALLAWRLGWPRWISAISVALAAWGVAGLLIVQLVIRINLPLELPTEQFLAGGSGEVLDAGAGSGRSSLMVLRARPESRVLALDLYDGYYGIPDNKPQRLMANAARAGVENRIEARVGDMREMPLGDASLDAAVSAYAIDHLNREGIERSMAEVYRVLRPNGQFLLMVINPDVWIRIAYPFFVHHGYYGGRTDHERWRSYLTKAGFEVVEQGTMPGTLYLLARKPGTVAERWRNFRWPSGAHYLWIGRLARISHQLSTAAADPGMSTALRSVGLLDVLTSTPPGASVARLVSIPVCTASLRNLVRNAG